MDKTATKSKILVVDTETTGKNPHTCSLLGIAVNCCGNISYENYNKDEHYSFYHLAKAYPLIGQNVKYDLIVLRRLGFKLPAPAFDTMIAHYLLHINKPHKLEKQVEQYFGVHKEDLVETYNKSTGEHRVNLPEDWHTKINPLHLSTYSMEDVKWTEAIYQQQLLELKARPVLRAWFSEVEMPLVDILTQMELKGVKVDRQQLSNLEIELKTEADTLKKRLVYLAGNKDFNLNSPKQLRELLYKKFKLPVYAHTTTREASTDQDTLKLLSERTEHAFPKLLSRFKTIDKILSTYTGSLIAKLDDNDRLHTLYNQALTNTRRFSSENPNLQNIPTRSDIGKRIKGCFVPAEGHKFLIADYSQLEPRILAHLSDDKWLIERFKNGDDIYEYTKEIVLSAGFKDFTRDRSKILFLALMYGKSSYGLSQDWHCTEKEAEEIIQSVFQKLSGVRAYINAIQERTFKTSGWLESLAGLPLYVGNPHSNNKWECAAVDRCAVNYPIQASSQDILKKAIVNIYKNSKGIFPVLMVHDELVFELKQSSAIDPMHNGGERLIASMIVDEMEAAWKLKVPLKVEWKIIDRWTK